MTNGIVPTNANQLALQDAGTDPTITTQSTYIDNSLTASNTNVRLDIGIHHGSPFGSGTTFGYHGLQGTMYGFAKGFKHNINNIHQDYSLVQNGTYGSSRGSLGSGNLLSTYDFIYYGPSSSKSPMRNWIDNSITFTTIAGGHQISSTGTMGSIGDGTWTADDGNTYEILQLMWMKNTLTSGTFPNTGSPNLFQGSNAAGDNDSNYIMLSYRKTGGSGTGPAFGELNIGGLTLKPYINGVQNASHSYNGYGGSLGTMVSWYGFSDSQIDNIGTSGTIDFELKGVSETNTYNNGIAEEFGGADSSDVRMSHYYAGGTLVSSSVSGIPSSGEIKISQFYGKKSLFDETIDSTLSADSYEVDTPAVAQVDLNVHYDTDGDIRIRISGGDTINPSSNTMVYRIHNPPSGYTVRKANIAFSGSDTASTSGNIGSTATSVPTTPTQIYFRASGNSGGGFDDFGEFNGTVTGDLIFEKSGNPTFTYSFTISLQAENAGEGGQ